MIILREATKTYRGPSLEPSQGNGSNGGSQTVIWWKSEIGLIRVITYVFLKK